MDVGFWMMDYGCWIVGQTFRFAIICRAKALPYKKSPSILLFQRGKQKGI
jgi:hypothetical protein